MAQWIKHLSPKLRTGIQIPRTQVNSRQISMEAASNIRNLVLDWEAESGHLWKKLPEISELQVQETHFNK